MNINRQAWFKQAIKKERWKEPGWVTRLFCVTDLENVNDIVIDTTKPIPAYELFVSLDNKSYCFWDDESQEFIPIDGSDVTEPLFKVSDKITLNPGDLPNVTEVTQTTFGNVIINLYCCVYPFGSKLPFFTGKLSGEEIEAMVIQRAAKGSGKPQEGEILPEEIDRYKKSVSALAAFSPICCPTASRGTLTVSKDVIAKRDELLKKHEHEIDDPAVVAMIEKELLDLDKKMNAGDPAYEGFFGPVSKLRNVGRKRQKIIYGVEGGIDGRLRTIKSSLSEGMDYKLIPLTADTITAASQSRGSLTAQGGELVKYNLRMFQNSSIVEDDCGTKGYLPIRVNEDNGWLENRNMFVGEKTVTITKGDLKGLIGKDIKLRSPGYCLTKDRNFCKSCVDVNLAMRPDGVAVAASAGASKIMMDAMKAMHGRQNDSFEFNLIDHLS